MAKVTVKLFGVYRMDTHLAKAEMEAERLNELLEKLHVLVREKAKESGNVAALFFAAIENVLPRKIP